MKRKSKDSLNNDDDVDYMDIPLQVPDVEVRSDVDRPRKLSKAQRSLRRIDMMSMTREVGLSVPIGSDNKGYHLLTKFGYSEGGLGKDGTGISEPIAVTHRPPTVTVGIGIEREFKEAMKKKEIRFAELVARRDEITSAFKIAQTQRHEATKMSRELRKNRKIIVNLDRTRGIAPHVLWEEADIREALNRDMEPAVVSLEMFVLKSCSSIAGILFSDLLLYFVSLQR